MQNPFRSERASIDDVGSFRTSMEIYYNALNHILNDRKKSEKTFQLCLNQSKVYREQLLYEDARYSEIMEIQEQEMAAVLSEGNQKEIEALVELHLLTKSGLEKRFSEQRRDLQRKQIIEFHELLQHLTEKAALSPKKESLMHKPRIKDHHSESLEKRKTLTHKSSSSDQSRLEQAKEVGKRVVGPLFGAIPGSFSVIMEPADAASDNCLFDIIPVECKVQLPIFMGAVNQVRFKIIGCVIHEGFDNIYDDGSNIGSWERHLEGLSSQRGCSAIISPFSSNVRSSFVLKAANRSTELVFEAFGKSITNLDDEMNMSFHSNVNGVHTLIRVADVRKAISHVEDLRLISRIGIVIDEWGHSSTEMLLKIKESLMECATKRYRTAGLLEEIAFIKVSESHMRGDQKRDWTTRVKTQLESIFH